MKVETLDTFFFPEATSEKKNSSKSVPYKDFRHLFFSAFYFFILQFPKRSSYGIPGSQFCPPFCGFLLKIA